jgi:orotidine-5'-phosphate decarboxylase
VLVRTSNPSASDFQDLPAGGTDPLSFSLAAMVDELGADGTGDDGLADVGAVVGATAPDQLAALRQLMPHAIFLLPGVGAQGGQIELLKEAFAPGPAGGLITASRSIVGAHEQHGGDPAGAARAVAQRLQGDAWALAPSLN